MTITVERGVHAPMPDGTRLAADVYRPALASGCPTVVLRTPYDRGLASAYGQQVNAIRLAEAGYAVVVQDVRGRFDSEGDFYPFRQEGDDGLETVEWAAAQPWSSGAVGLAGASYCGFAQVLAARRGPPSLAAWLPLFTPIDARDGWVYEGGAFCLGFNVSWTIAHIAPRDRRTADPAALLAALDAWPETIRRPPEEQPECAATPAGSYYFDWLSRRDDDAYWASASGKGFDASAPPAVVVGGWFDLFAKGSIDLFADLASGAPGRHRLVMGPWDHSPLPLGSSSGESEFGVAAALDLHALQRAWLDTYLRGESEPDWPAARTFVTGWNRWEGWPAWPPPHRPEDWFLQPGGGLDSARPPAAEDRFLADADDPTPTLGGPLCCWKGRLPPGQVDQRARVERRDVLTYLSEPLAQELVVAGPVRAEIWSSTSAHGADVFATLVDVDPRGRGLNVVEGIRRRGEAGPEPELFDVDLGHVAHAFLPGHRIRLDVSAMSFPRFDRLPGTGRAERAVSLGTSRLVLPVAT